MNRIIEIAHAERSHRGPVRGRAIGFLLAAGVALGACTSSTAARPTVSPNSRSGAGDELRRAANTWARAANERDGAAMSEYFADDAIAMYPRHSQPTVGKNLNRAGWIKAFATPGWTLPLAVDSIAISASGDMGYTYGRWHLKTVGTSSAPALDIGGRYLAVWRPIGEGRAWRIVILSANEHRPAPSM